jgi:hypothetical protein
MTCLECLQLLQRAMDREPPENPPAFAEHIARCSSCAGLHAAGQSLSRGLKDMPAAVLAPDFSQRMTRLVLQDRRVRRRHLQRRLRITMVLAASILIMAVAGYFLTPIPTNGPGSDPFAAENQRKPPEKETPSPHLAQSVDDARQAIATLSGRWANQAKEQTKNFIAATPALEIPDLNAAAAQPVELDAAALSLRQASQGLAEGLLPLANTTKRAFVFFVQDMPVLSESN